MDKSQSSSSHFCQSLRRAAAIGTAVAFLVLEASPAFATNYYWVGSRSGSTHWNAPTNWSTVPSGPGNGAAPGAADLAIFFKTGGTVQMKSAVNVMGIYMGNNWTGSILQGTGTLTIGSLGMRVGSGRFIGGNVPIYNSGSYTQTGGIVAYIMSRFSHSGSFSVRSLSSTTNPTFTSTGTVIASGSGNYTYTFGANSAGTGRRVFLKNFTLNNRGASTSTNKITVSGAILSLSGTLRINTGKLDLDQGNVPLVTNSGIVLANSALAAFVGDGNITASGYNIVAGDSASFNLSGTTTLTMKGNSQTLDVNGDTIYRLTVRSSSGTYMASDLVVTNQLQVNTGSRLSLNAFNIFATGTTIFNYGTIKENTGKLSHSGSDLLITNSSFVDVSSTSTPQTMYFTLTDPDGNLNGTSIDTLTVTASISGGDSETITLSETTFTSGVFRGSIPTAYASPTANNGQLQTPSDKVVTLSYTDSQDGLSITDTSSLVVVSGGGGGGGDGGGYYVPPSTSRSSSSAAVNASTSRSSSKSSMKSSSKKSSSKKSPSKKSSKKKSSKKSSSKKSSSKKSSSKKSSSKSSSSKKL
jgi:hypothetical protein